MNKFYKILSIVAVLLVAIPVFAAPIFRTERTILPEADVRYELGTSTRQWLRVFTETLCLDNDCRSTWPTGGSGGAYPFPLAGNATSTLTQFNGGLTAYSSSTISALTVTNGTTTNATSTNLFATNLTATNFKLSGIGTNMVVTTDANGNLVSSSTPVVASIVATSTTATSTFAGAVGIGTTSQYARFAVHANNGETNNTLFSIASSTASATTTLLSVSNTGDLILRNGSGQSTTYNVLGINTVGIDTYTIGGAAKLSLGTSGQFVNFAPGGGYLCGNKTTFLFADTSSNCGSGGGTAPNAIASLSRNGFIVQSGSYIGFNSITYGTSWTNTPDTILSRFAPRTMALGGPTSSTTGTLVLENIGLGTTSPYAQLSIVATSTTGVGAPTTLLAVASTTNGTATTTLFLIQNTGAVGIGTTSPYAKLSVVGEVVGANFTATTTGINTFPELSFTNATGTNATTTNLAISSLSSALVRVDANGSTLEYAGATCTNQFVRSLDAVGAATCATVANTDLANSTISGISLGSNLADLTATNGTLTFSGTYNGATARTIGLNLGNANNWTALQTFANASSTLFSTNGPFYVGTTSTTTIYGNATSTFTGGINLSNGGCFAISGICLSTGGSGTPGGSDGQVQYNNGGSFGGGVGVIWNDITSRFGIGSTTPTAKLVVQSNAGENIFTVASSTEKTVAYFDKFGDLVFSNFGQDRSGDTATTSRILTENITTSTSDELFGTNLSILTGLVNNTSTGDALSGGLTLSVGTASSSKISFGGGLTFESGRAQGNLYRGGEAILSFEGAQSDVIDGEAYGADVLFFSGDTTDPTNDNIASGSVFSLYGGSVDIGDIVTGGGVSFSAGTGANTGAGGDIVFSSGNAGSAPLYGSIYLGVKETFNVLTVHGPTARVGIGTTSPAYSLSVEGSSTLGNQAIAGYFTGTTTSTSTFAGSVFVGSTSPASTGSATFSVKGIMTVVAQFFTSSGTKVMEILDSGVVTLLGSWDFSGATVKVHTYPAFTYATSTSWTGTTTIPLAPAYTAESWAGIKCFTDTGTLNVSVNDGTNRMNMFNASTTVGTVTLSTNNTFTASEKRYVDIGTPASSPTKISCSVDKIVNN